MMRHLSRAERIVCRQLLSQDRELALHAVTHGLSKPRMQMAVLLIDLTERDIRSASPPRS